MTTSQIEKEERTVLTYGSENHDHETPLYQPALILQAFIGPAATDFIIKSTVKQKTHAPKDVDFFSQQKKRQRRRNGFEPR